MRTKVLLLAAVAALTLAAAGSTSSTVTRTPIAKPHSSLPDANYYIEQLPDGTLTLIQQSPTETKTLATQEQRND